ncbi:MAG: 50S ribosomal protein L10 [bacterium]|nr:50S ribosomal protein L10 [bacterium]
MPKTKTQKQSALRGISESLEKQQSLMFVNYKGIKVQDLSRLRSQLKEAGAKLEVAKKTLLSRALQEKGIAADLKSMDGQIAVIYSFEDPMAGVRTAHAFARGQESLKLLGGYMESRLLSESEVKELALLPSKEQLLGIFVSTLAAPVRGFLTVLEGNMKGLVVALSAIQEKKA